MPDLSVVIPVYNEAGNLNLLYARLEKALAPMGLSREYIFVNDGSGDASLQLIQALAAGDSAVRFVDLSRNFGHQIAVSAGIDAATGQALVIMDADLQDPPELIPELYARYREGFDVVYARRRRRAGDSAFKRLTAKCFYRLLGRMTQLDIPLDTGDFRIISHKVAAVLRQMPEPNKFLRGQIAWAGFRQDAIEFDRDSRHSGASGYPFRKMLRFALDGITAFSDFPLRIATLAGFVVSGIAFLLMVYALLARLVWKDYVEGWASLMLSVLFIGGIQLLSLGIIGEYIHRINQSVRQRPLYVVRESNIVPAGPAGRQAPAAESGGEAAQGL